SRGCTCWCASWAPRTTASTRSSAWSGRSASSSNDQVCGRAARRGVARPAHVRSAAMTRQVRLISVPFHNGLRGVSMGRGAARLAADHGFRNAFERAGFEVEDREIEAVDESLPEIARTIELIRQQALEVRAAVDDGAFPLVLSGNCNSSLATVA